MQKVVSKIKWVLPFAATNTALAQTKVAQIMKNIETNVIRPLISLLLVLATAVFLWGIVEYLWHTDSEEKQTQGKKHIVWGIVGLTVMIAVWGIVRAVSRVICGGPCPTEFTP